MVILQVRLRRVVIVNVVRHRVTVINVVPILINTHVAVPVIVREVERLVVANIRVVPVLLDITGTVVVVNHIITHVRVGLMSQVRLAVMGHLVQYLRNVVVERHMVLVILVRVVLVVPLVPVV